MNVKDKNKTIFFVINDVNLFSKDNNDVVRID